MVVMVNIKIIHINDKMRLNSFLKFTMISTLYPC